MTVMVVVGHVKKTLCMQEQWCVNYFSEAAEVSQVRPLPEAPRLKQTRVCVKKEQKNKQAGGQAATPFTPCGSSWNMPAGENPRLPQHTVGQIFVHLHLRNERKMSALQLGNKTGALTRAL